MRVLVLAAPCLHLGYLGCYGCDWVSTPHLDRLASEGIVFDRHFADCPAPRSQFRETADVAPNRSWWTGRYCFPAPGSKEAEDPEPAPHLFSLLEAQGIAAIRIITRSRMAGAGQSPSLQFPRRRLLNALAGVANQPRWLVWVDLPSLAPPWPALPDKLLRWYFPEETAGDEEPLTPWLDPSRGVLDLAEDAGRERLQGTYAAALSYFDAQVGRLLKELQARNWYENVMLCFTADRGLALGEHGMVGDAMLGLHEEVIHLPLLVRMPGAAEAGRRVAALSQPVDLYPTLLAALGLAHPAVHGRSLLPLLRGEAEEIRPYACAGHAVDGAVEYALRTPEWSFLRPEQAVNELPRPPRLYVKPDDRWEVNNVVQHHQELAQELERTLHSFVRATRQPGPLPPPDAV